MTAQTAAVPAQRRSTEQPDLTGFLTAHLGMRQEFGLLAEVARQPLSPERARLAEEHIAFVFRSLHHHHTAEDDTVWPWLRSRVPAAVPELDLLEAEHETIDPLLEAGADTSVPLAERADVLQRLHELVNAHLDREERVAVPLIRSHVTVAEWEALGERMMRETPRRDLPTLFGWYASACTPEQRAAALAGVARLPRLLFRLIWEPAYRRRFELLYGVTAR